MRRFAVLFLIVTAGCGPSNAPNANPQPGDNKPKHDYQGWKVYAPAEGGFEVRFPQDPVLTKASPATGNLHMAGLKRQTPEELGYNCQWIFQAKPFANKEAEMVYLKRELKDALQSHKGKLVEESETPIAAGSGRQMIMELGPDNFLQYRMYVSGKLTVILQVGGKNPEAVRSKNAVMFFDSLKFGA